MPCRSSVRRARPGEPVNLTLFFHADEVPSADLGFNLFTPYLPTTQWAAGDILRFAVPAYLPADAEGQYQFTLQLAQSPERSVQLRPVNVIPIPRTFTPPSADHPLNGIHFGSIVELSGYTLAAGPQAFTLDLVWHALGTPGSDLVAFVHVEDYSGKIVAQSDAVPAGGSRPTRGWLTGEYILDSRQFTALPPGRYNLFVGLYDSVTGKRLDDRLKIGTFTVP